ncbi:hypothetical protein KBB49_03765 [Candidatus Saccharibacteria bacterium]|nr:hypothetical protein [Candidatus Saccharibacteria bacterium]
MSRLLVQLLSADERQFRAFIERLERACLSPGVDIRLSAEIITKTRDKARFLGLDAVDTTAKEMYFALKNKLQQDDLVLKNKLKIDDNNTVSNIEKLAKQATKLSKKELTLCVSAVGVKRVLIAVPPRKTLRLLKLRSLESVLKREDPRVLYTLALQIEDSSWKSQVHAKIKRLQSKDISWQSVEVLPMPLAWLEKANNAISHHGFMISCPDIGVVVVMPVIKTFTPGTTTMSLGLILQAVQRLSIGTMPYRKQGFVQGYQNILPEIAHNKQPLLIPIHGLQPSWRAVHQLLSLGLITEDSPDVELILGDLNWESTEMKIASLVPDFDYWVDTHYLGVKTDGVPVSLHLLDVAREVLVDSNYETRQAKHLEGSLWNELQIRYLTQDAMSKSLSQQLLGID